MICLLSDHLPAERKMQCPIGSIAWDSHQIDGAEAFTPGITRQFLGKRFDMGLCRRVQESHRGPDGIGTSVCADMNLCVPRPECRDCIAKLDDELENWRN